MTSGRVTGIALHISEVDLRVSPHQTARLGRSNDEHAHVTLRCCAGPIGSRDQVLTLLRRTPCHRHSVACCYLAAGTPLWSPANCAGTMRITTATRAQSNEHVADGQDGVSQQLMRLLFTGAHRALCPPDKGVG